MRKTQQLLAEYLRRNGIKISFIAEAAGIRYELLRRSLNGARVMTADELAAILMNTEITLDDFM